MQSIIQVAKKPVVRSVIRIGLILTFVSFVGYFLWRDGQTLATYDFQLNPGLLLLSVIIVVGGLGVAIAVWHHILAKFGGKSAYGDDWRIYSYSMLGTALPGRIWSTVSRVALYNELGVTMPQVTTASLVEFLVTGLGGGLLFGITTLFNPAPAVWNRPVVFWGVLLISLVLIQPVVIEQIVRWLSHLFNQPAPLDMQLQYRDLGIWVVLSASVIFIGGIAIYVLLQSVFPVEPSLVVPVVQAWAIASLVSNLLFWLPGTLIVKDGVMLIILSPELGMTESILLVLLVRVWTLAIFLLLSVSTWLLFDRKRLNVKALWTKTGSEISD